MERGAHYSQNRKKQRDFSLFLQKKRPAWQAGQKSTKSPYANRQEERKPSAASPEGLVLPQQAQAVLFQRKIAKHRPTFAERAGQRTAPRAPVRQALSPWAEARRQKAPPSSKSRKRQPSSPLAALREEKNGSPS